MRDGDLPAREGLEERGQVADRDEEHGETAGGFHQEERPSASADRKQIGRSTEEPAGAEEQIVAEEDLSEQPAVQE